MTFATGQSVMMEHVRQRVWRQVLNGLIKTHRSRLRLEITDLNHISHQLIKLKARQPPRSELLNMRGGNDPSD